MKCEKICDFSSCCSPNCLFAGCVGILASMFVAVITTLVLGILAMHNIIGISYDSGLAMVVIGSCLLFYFVLQVLGMPCHRSVL